MGEFTGSDLGGELSSPKHCRHPTCWACRRRNRNACCWMFDDPSSVQSGADAVVILYLTPFIQAVGDHFSATGQA